MNERGSDDRSLFSPIILGFLVASVVAIFALSTLLASLGSGENTPHDATVDSPSSIGHEGFYTLLQRLDLPVDRTREPAAHDPVSLLLLVEPVRKFISFRTDSNLEKTPNVLIVLPKWNGKPDLVHDGWVREVTPSEMDAAQSIVRLLDWKATVLRETLPPRWDRNTIAVDPVVTGKVQLIESSRLRPLIATEGKMLLGELVTKRQRIWVLADPDPIENHGIAKPPNTHFALALISKLKSGHGRILFDERVHGAPPPERNWIQLLFQFPYVIVTGQLLVLLALLLLATTSRFGGAEVETSPFEQGKMRLIDNIAALMDRAGHQGVVLRRYISVKLAEAGRALHAPTPLDENALADWLDRVGTSRGVGGKARAILERSAATAGRRSKISPRLFSEAHDTYHWTKDLLDASGGRQNNR